VEQEEEILSQRIITRSLALREGEPLNLLRWIPPVCGSSRDSGDQGYADAIVDTAVMLNDRETSAAVRFTLNPRWITTVEEIHVHENERITERTIRRSLTFREGDLFRLSPTCFAASASCTSPISSVGRSSNPR
jgi:hypothetical protein